MEVHNSTDLVVTGPVQSGLYGQVVLLYRWSLRRVRCYHIIVHHVTLKVARPSTLLPCSIRADLA